MVTVRVRQKDDIWTRLMHDSSHVKDEFQFLHQKCCSITRTAATFQGKGVVVVIVAAVAAGGKGNVCGGDLQRHDGGLMDEMLCNQTQETD